jgi:hypothetical protein
MQLRTLKKAAVTAAAVAGVAGAAAAGANATGQHQHTTFAMQRSAGVVKANCLPNAYAKVTVTPRGPVEVMTVDASGLAKNTNFDFFVIQVPNAPFGVSWYQGDLESNDKGRAYGVFVGRFNIETFAVAPNTAPAPVTHSQAPFPDASSNPPFKPLHTYHLGLWFNSPKDAAANGCPSVVTPFNGDHNAGLQVLNTAQFPDLAGPLSRIKP